MKKAQIQMFETVGVLVVFFFLLVAGAVFYFNIQKSSMQKELVQQAQLRSLQSAQRAVFLPELDCSFARVTRDNCFDRFKIAALHEIIANDDHTRQVYTRSFGYANISVTEVFPGSGTTVIYDYPPEEYRGILKSQLPVLLYDPVTWDAAFGIMEVTTYAS